MQAANEISGLPARRSALSALARTLDKRQAMEEAFAADPSFAALPGSDRGFAQLLVRTTLRRLGQIDAILAPLLARPLDQTPDNALHMLRLGAAQLLFLETPPHAAIHSMVELAKTQSMKQSGMINAVLRRLEREGRAALQSQDAPRINTPAWLWASWLTAYGEQATRAIATAHLEEPPLDLSIKETPEEWAKTLGGTLLPNNTVRLANAGPIPELPGYSEGAWWVQDAAAAEPARILIEAMGGNIRDKNIVEFCAAPGGKTAQLAAAGAHVTAIDISENRVRRLKENLARLNLPAQCLTADAGTWTPQTPLDAILLDAPCSATGTIRRHPDVACHRTPGDIQRLAVTQHRLIHHSLSLLAPGGILVYAVCSLQPEEGKAHFALAKNLQFDRVLLPDGHDWATGFYIAVVRKTG